MANSNESKKPVDWLNIGLWTVQILLMIGYAIAGYMKLFVPLPELAKEMGYVADVPVWFIKSVGIAEAAGAIGIVLPAAMRILPWLTPLAAACFSLVQVVAIGIHAAYGETAQFLPFNLLLLSMSVFVLWGRWKKRPIAAH